MELEVHLTNIDKVLENLTLLEKGTYSTSLYDIKKVVEAVKYLLETNSLNKETLN